MAYFTKKAIVRELKKLNLEIQEVSGRKFQANASDKYRIEVTRINDSEDAKWLVAITDMKDPDNMQADYFTTMFPDTLKEISLMLTY